MEVKMPKIKEVTKGAEKAVKKGVDQVKEMGRQVFDDKEERAENCFKELQEAHIKMCFKSTGQEVVNYAQIEGLTVGHRDVLHEEMLNYCLGEFNKKDIVKCETLSTFKTAVEAPIADAADAAKEYLAKSPPPPPPHDEA
jgi:hypothetical protein